jgi:CDP-diacylglycerol--glycerol-3-phosphate 3-phosphatidyltransferase
LAGKSEIRNRLRSLLSPLVAVLELLGVTPIGVTLFGLALSFFGGWLVSAGWLAWGGVVLILTGLCDTLDGSLARSTGKVSRFGAFFDSVADRISEMAYFAGLVYYYSDGSTTGGLIIFFTLAALTGSFLTSYTRARAEGLDMECTVGLLERPERIVLLVTGLLLGRTVLNVVIIVLAVLSIYTFIQRILHVRNLTLEGESASDADPDMTVPV